MTGPPGLRFGVGLGYALYADGFRGIRRSYNFNFPPRPVTAKDLVDEFIPDRKLRCPVRTMLSFFLMAGILPASKFPAKSSKRGDLEAGPMLANRLLRHSLSALP